MLSFLVVIYLALYYIRPAEWVPGLIGSRILFYDGIASVLFLAFCTITNIYPNILKGFTERMMFGFVMAITMSHLSHAYFGGAFNSVNNFLPIFTGFLLVVCYVDSISRFRTLLFLIIALTTFLAYEGCLQYVSGFADGGLEPLYEGFTLPSGEPVKLPRIRWYGVLNDPNDLGLTLVLVVPFLVDMLMQRRFVLPLLTLPLIVPAIYYTNSRGTFLSGLGALGCYFVIRYRSTIGLFVGGVLAAILMMFGPSRMSSLSTASDASAHGRVDAWNSGFQMLKSAPFFGVGQDMFVDINGGLTAHNSYVLVMAELGVFGLFCYTGLFYIVYHWLWCRVFKVEILNMNSSDLGLISAAYASLTGVLVAMFFLSRVYFLLPFMLVAMITGLTRVIDLETTPLADLQTDSPHHVRNIAVLTVIVIIGLNIIVKFLI